MCNTDGTPGPTKPAPSHGAQAQYYNDAAALYADPKIRLHYPPELFQRVYAFAGPVTAAALDVATGTGQCARQLASRYQQVGVPGSLSMMQPVSVSQSAALRWTRHAGCPGCGHRHRAVCLPAGLQVPQDLSLGADLL